MAISGAEHAKIDAAPAQARRRVEFRLDGSRVPGARSVTIVSSFNHWDATTHRLTRQPNAVWTISVELPPETYPYLFIVDGYPYNDLEDDGRMPCEWGGWYSIRVVR